MKADSTKTTGHTNPDAITGAPESHPGATGIGAASGAATGAAVGMIGGPIGAVIGAVAGGIVGGMTGHEIGEWNDPSDAAYWKDEYKNRSYYDRSADFDKDVAPALNYGGTLATTTADAKAYTGGTGTPAGAKFDALEAKAKEGWDKVRGNSKLTYDQARGAISDAYDRKIRLHEENLRAEKDRVQTGEARISKQVTVENRTIQVPVEHEELVIERRSVSGAAASGTKIGSEEIRIPLSEERVRVEKDTVVTEEVSIGKKKRVENQEVGGEVRKERLVVDDPSSTTSSTSTTANKNK